jgi:hypothetical protein
MSGKSDDSLFDDSQIHPEYQESSQTDSSLFDDSQIHPESMQNEQDQTENITQTPIEAAFSELTPAITAGTVEAIRQGAASSPVSSLAEDLAFRGAGGISSSIGTDLIKEQAISKGIGSINPSSVVEPTVNPKKVGRAILDESLLGPLGLGTKSGNLSRATKASIEASIPTNQLLQSLTTPIKKQDIQDRTEILLNLAKLDPAVSANKAIKQSFESKQGDFSGFQLPLEAEETKRQLQAGVNYLTPESKAMSAVERAQAQATREQVEKAAELVGKLEDFKKLKSKSGNVQVAKDIIESVIKPSNVTFPGSGLISMVADLATKKAPAIGATALDTVGKVAKSKLGKALPYVAGALAGGIPAVAGEIAGEALDSTTSGALPTTISTDVQGQPFAPFYEEKGFTPEEAVKRAEISQFQEEYGTQPKTIQQEYPTNLALEGMSDIVESPQITSQRQSLQKQKKMLEESRRLRDERRLETQKVKQLGALAPSYVEAPLKQVLKADNPSEIASIAQSMQASPDRASQEYSRVLSQIVDAPASQKEAVLFGLNQQPAFRELLKKLKDEKETEEEVPLMLKGPA